MENTGSDRKIYLYTIIAWLLFMLFYGWLHTANSMTQFTATPASDANNAASQTFSFMQTYGLFAIQMLGFILLFEAWVIENPRQLIKNYMLKRAPDIRRWALERIAPETNKSTGMKKVLNVGGNNKEIPLPHEYAEFEHLLLDIDPRGLPDIVCDARELSTLEAEQFEAVYCSHNLEHYYRHDVSRVLSGFLHVLKEGGFVHLRVPDMEEVMRMSVEQKLDIDDTLYQSAAGPIMVLDVMYGYGVEIEQSGQDFYAHKTGFTKKSLETALRKAGFSTIYSGTGNIEVFAIAFKGVPDEASLALFSLASG